MSQDIAEKLECLNRVLSIQEEALKHELEDRPTLASTANDDNASKQETPEKLKNAAEEPLTNVSTATDVDAPEQSMPEKLKHTFEIAADTTSKANNDVDHNQETTEMQKNAFKNDDVDDNNQKSSEKLNNEIEKTTTKASTACDVVDQNQETPLILRNDFEKATTTASISSADISLNQKTPEKRKAITDSATIPEKQHKSDEESTIKTPERKSIIEIRITNAVNMTEPLCDTPAPARIEHTIIDLEKRQGGIISTTSIEPEMKLDMELVTVKTEAQASPKLTPNSSAQQIISSDNSESFKDIELEERQEGIISTTSIAPEMKLDMEVITVKTETLASPNLTSQQIISLETNERIKDEIATPIECNLQEKSTENVIKIETAAATINGTSNTIEITPSNEINAAEIDKAIKTEDEILVKFDKVLPIKEEEEEEGKCSIIPLTEAELALDKQYRESCLPFLQHVPCFKLKTSNNAPYDDEKVPRCRECRRKDIITQTNDAEASTGSDVYCRFYEFRRLLYTAAGELSVSGFPNPYQDPEQKDINIWQPDECTEPTAGYMDVQVCRYILLHVGDQFCYLWQQEVEALKLHQNPDDKIAWKKLVRDIREICDVCDTTLFNYHWTCNKCGFGVCLDCFKDRKEERMRQKFSSKSRRGRDEYYWLLCTNSKKHQLAELMLTQIITGDSLKVLGKLLHEVRIIWKIPQKCDCLLSHETLPDGPTKDKLDEIVDDMINESRLNQQTAASSLATKETLRHQRRMEKFHKNKLDFARSLGIDYVPGRIVTKETLDKDPITTAFDSYEHINFLRKGMAGFRRFLPPKVMTMCSSTMLAPNVRHEWLCDGKLLRLTDPMHPDNRILFQEVWKCGQPVMVSEVARSLNLDLWRPEAFCRDFGDKPNDLINCLNGNLVPNQPMRHFWEGFQCIKKRLLDASGNPMLLKLKDWPPGDDFAEILPTRFADLMKGLPLPEYTLRTGNLNIASCLPKMFVPPDLGPKMYNAYGSALHPDKGTTNLHLDISDAVNVMVYVGIPQDAESKSQIDAAQHAIAMGGCDFLTRLRCQSSKVLPGALWHIFAARDADKIRDLLNRVTLEKGFRLEPDHDPIHDQNWYLDDELRARLFCEYRVKGYPIVQCLGDAVFIPAGAPHQVQNLHNCIKVAEDFVSPENITHCYHLTHEFRHLSNSHTNHEDKLQIKNIIYHSVKDCCTILTRALDRRYELELAELKRKRKLAREEKRNAKKNSDFSNVELNDVD